MQYKNVAQRTSGSNAIHDYGQSATVAVQNDDASAGLSYPDRNLWKTISTSDPNLQQPSDQWTRL